MVTESVILSAQQKLQADSHAGVWFRKIIGTYTTNLQCDACSGISASP
jgi:hypothetical protein